MAKEVSQENPDLSQGSKPTGSSESQGTPLDGMRGVSSAFTTLDAQNAIEEPSAPEAPDALEQVLEGDTPAEEGGQEEADPTDGDGQQQALESESEVDDDVAALQERLLASDKDRTKRAQEAAFLKGKLGELDQFIQLGISVADNPELHAYVNRTLKGEPTTVAQQKAGAAAVKKSGMTPEVFMNNIVQQVSQKVTQDLDANAAAARQFNKMDARAHKELKHYDAVQKHHKFLGILSAMNMAVDNGTLLVPEGEDPNYYAMAQTHDVIIASEPDYIKAVHEAGVKKGKKSTAKKMAGAGPTGSSRGSTQVEGKDLSQDQKDRVGMLQAYLKGGTGRRLPGAR